jgi:hypothetical protein
MIPGNSTPVTRPVLAVVPDVSALDPGNTPSPAAPGPVTQAGNTRGRVTGPASGNAAAVTASPETPGAVVPMTPPERARHTAARWVSVAAEAVRELWLKPGRLLHVAWHGKPESMAEHQAYMQSAAWVPGEMTGRPAKAVIAAGVFYHLLIACPLKAAAKTVDAAADRPLRLLCLAVFVITLILLALL